MSGANPPGTGTVHFSQGPDDSSFVTQATGLAASVRAHTITGLTPDAGYRVSVVASWNGGSDTCDLEADNIRAAEPPPAPTVPPAGNTPGAGGGGPGGAPATGAPVADAGEDLEVTAGAAVTLDGSGSSDPDGDPLTFAWTQTGGTAVTLDDAAAAQPAFTAPALSGTLAFTLTVSDPSGAADSDTVTVRVRTEAAQRMQRANAQMLPQVMRATTAGMLGGADRAHRAGGGADAARWRAAGGGAVRGAAGRVRARGRAAAGGGRRVVRAAGGRGAVAPGRTPGRWRRWRCGAAATTAASATDRSAEASYGIAVLGGQAVLTPLAGVTVAEDAVSSYRLGGRFALAEEVRVSLVGEHRGGSAPALTLTGSLHP